MCLGCSKSLRIGSIVMFEDVDGEMLLGAVSKITLSDGTTTEFILGRDINCSKTNNPLCDYTCDVLTTNMFSGGWQETSKVRADKLFAVNIYNSYSEKEIFGLLEKKKFPFYYADVYDKMLEDEKK